MDNYEKLKDLKDLFDRGLINELEFSKLKSEILFSDKSNKGHIKESENNMPPNFILSNEENIILCGLVDWLEYIETDDSVKILDFKTGKHDETEDSLQLPIYLLLLNALQKRKISGASYWYLDRDDKPIDMPLPTIEQSKEKVLAVALKVKEAREKKIFNCPRGEEGCFACRPFEKILQGKAEYLGVGGYGCDIYSV